MKKLFSFLMFVLGLDCDIRRNAVDNGICDYSGQGRNEYGK